MARFSIRENHPLYSRWHWHKNRHKAGMVLEWAGDFWAFVRGVGEPRDGYTLRRINKDKPIGPSNFEWRKKEFSGLHKNRAAYQRAYRKLRPANVRNTELKKLYGITLAEYNAMLESQGGGCAICGGQQTHSRFKNLSVDHCHDTGKVRGLLCNNCNLAIGKIGHDVDKARKMVQYLER